MHLIRNALIAAAVVSFAGAGYLYAQDAPDDIVVPGGTDADLGPREMAAKSKTILAEMEAIHVRVLQLQSQARKVKDVIKLNCVNEKLLAVKQLLNIAEAAENELTGAISGGDRDAMVHQYSQIQLSSERATGERAEAEACIGEEIIFIGPTKVDTDAPPVIDDPTAGDGFDFSGNDLTVEGGAFATPFGFE